MMHFLPQLVCQNTNFLTLEAGDVSSRTHALLTIIINLNLGDYNFDEDDLNSIVFVRLMP